MVIRKYAASVCMVFAATLTIPAITFAGDDMIEFTTYADARPLGGIRTGADIEDGLDSPGDVFVFDQFLLAADQSTRIGRNAGFCIRTDAGADDFSSTDDPDSPFDDPDNNYGACQWTLSFGPGSGFEGSSLTVAGREADVGTSIVPIIGGTGQFMGATGALVSTPHPQDAGGVLFQQDLLIIPRDFDGDSDDDSDSDDDD